MHILLQIWLLVTFQVTTLVAQSMQRPNILFIIADDLGWNDVSWHNPEMITPNLERLARTGVILDQSYVQPMCSPSRSSFMTGMYPYHTGMQHFVILSDQGFGVPLNFTMLPQVLREQAGYAAHIVGKWHLGFCRWEYTPLRRGFQSFTGYYNGMEDYYSREMGDDLFYGYDFRENETVSYANNGTYSAYTFVNRAINVIDSHNTQQPLFLYLAFQNVHEPLEVPEQYSNLYSHIDNVNRRKFCGMVSALDEAIGNVTKALDARGMLDNTVIIFTTDNGGPTYRSANNWPLRGAKTTLWEGGTRGAAFVSGAPLHLQQHPYTSNNLMHAIDWFPTILELAGVNVTHVPGLQYTLDGVSQLNSFKHNVAARSEFVYNIDDVDQNAAIRWNNYKLIVGYPGNYSECVPPPHVEYSQSQPNHALRYVAEELLHSDIGAKSDKNEMQKFKMFGNTEIRLFDVVNDPSESNEISAQHPDIVASLLDRLGQYKKTLVPAQNPKADPRADPKNWNGAWSPGWC